MAFDPTQSYDDLPLLPPAAEVETKAILRQALRATRALGELKGAGGLIPDQALLIDAIPLQEAKASSEIENIVTTQDELYRASVSESAATDPATKEVLRYRTALRQGYEGLKTERISLDMIRRICSTLHGEPVQFRGVGERVRIGNPANGKTTYTPPAGGRVLRGKLSNFEAWMRADDGVDPLIRMAVGHYQFEAIHPFADGNGRTGRILNVLYLLQAGLLDLPVLYLSRHIIRHKNDYYRLLKAVTERGEWEPWILYMLRGVEETALWTVERIKAVRHLLDATADRCRKEIPKTYSKELVETVFRGPYCKIAFLVEGGLAERKTASEYLKELERIGILQGEKRGREVIYRHPALIEALKG